MAMQYLGTGLLRVADVGLATAIPTQHLAAPVNAIRTSGYSVHGKGAATYVSDASATAGLAAAHPRVCKQSLDGRYWRLLIEDGVDVQQLGALGDGTADDTAAIQAAATLPSALVQRIYFPAGTYGVSSEIALGSSVTLCGDGTGSKIVKLGSGPANIFVATNQSAIRFQDLWLYGNNQTSSNADGCAIRIIQNGSAAATSRGFYLQNCRFDNFQGDYWVYFVNDSTTQGMAGIYVDSCEFHSYSGNARNGASPGVPSICLSIGSVGGGATGINIADIHITNNTANCSYIKSFVAFWQGVSRAVVSGNVVNGCGTDASISDSCGAYAILAYDSSGLNLLHDITIAGNTIAGVRSCGFYGASAKNVRVTGNSIANQTDTVADTLPKGAIIFNGGEKILVSGNRIETVAAVGVYWKPGNAAAGFVSIQHNTIKDAATGVSLVSASFDSSDIAVSDNLLTGGLHGILVTTFGTAFIDRLAIKNNSIASAGAGSRGIRLYSDDSLQKVKNTAIIGNSIKADGYGIDWAGCTLGATAIHGNTLTGPFATAAMYIASSQKLSIIGNSFVGQTSAGYCLWSEGAQGALWANAFVNCAGANIVAVLGSADMGRVTPTWTPAGREQVQNVLAAEAGSAGSKYIVTGWFYDGTAWREQRCPTEALSTIAGITGTLAQFNTAVTDADLLSVADAAATYQTISGFTEAAQDVVGALVAAAGGSYNDAAGTITLPGAAGGTLVNNGSTTVNFGAFPGTSDASVTIAGQASIGAGSKVKAYIIATATADHSADEHWAETLDVMAGNIVPGTGFTIYAKNTGTLSEPVTQSWAGARLAGPGTGINQAAPRYAAAGKAPGSTANTPWPGNGFKEKAAWQFKFKAMAARLPKSMALRSARCAPPRARSITARWGITAMAASPAFCPPRWPRTARYSSSAGPMRRGFASSTKSSFPPPFRPPSLPPVSRCRSTW